MTLLTGVVSVTNIALKADEVTDAFELNCNMPHRFLISRHYDLPEMDHINASLSAFRLFTCYLQSELRFSLINASLMKSGNVLGLNSDLISDEFGRILKGQNISRDCESVPETWFPVYFGPGKRMARGELRSTNPMSSFRYEISGMEVFYDHAAIKRRIADTEKPVTLHIDVDVRNISRNGVIQETSQSDKFRHFIIYGWNDDFLGGGFIVRHFGAETMGHSITFLYGDLTHEDERGVCAALGNPKSIPCVTDVKDLGYESALTCVDNRTCDRNETYFLRCRAKNDSEQWIDVVEKAGQVKAHFFIGNGTELAISMSNLTELTRMFRLGRSQSRVAVCGYWFLPYDVLRKNHGMAMAFDIRWKTLSQYSSDCCSASEHLPELERPWSGFQIE
jgi:hypothetical protein